MHLVDRPNDRFQPGSAVFGSRFFGREALLDAVLGGHRHALWLLGPRHYGKTSLLLELRYRTEDPRQGRFTPLYVPLGGVKDAAGLSRALAVALEKEARVLELHGLQLGASERSGSLPTRRKSNGSCAKGPRRRVP